MRFRSGRHLANRSLLPKRCLNFIKIATCKLLSTFLLIPYFQEANFEIQIEVVEENQRVTKTLGICEVDMGNCVKSGMGELFCLPNDSSPFESVILPCIRVSLRHHEMDQLVTTTSTETASISESSVQIKHIQVRLNKGGSKDGLRSIL